MTPPVPLVIGLDVGTSSVKAAVFGADGARGAVVRRAVSTTNDGHDHVTQEVDQLRDATLGALAETVAHAPRRPDAVAVCTAMHGLAGLDAAGRPLTPLVIWADHRATEIVEAWKQTGTAAFVHHRTGVPLHPMAPLAKLAWFAEAEPATAQRVTRWVDLKALVLQWLTGEAVTEISSASGWGLMDIRSHLWDHDALELARVDETRLPGIESSTAIRPLITGAAEQVSLPAGTPVILGAGDGPLGNVGVGAIHPGVAGLSLGTSGAVRVVVDHVPERIPGLFCYALTERQWVLGGAVSNGGNITRWLADALLAHPSGESWRDREAVLALAASSAPGSDGLVMLPYLVAERAPLWDAEMPGAYLGVRRGHTAEHFARAAIEGVSAGLGVVADQIAARAPCTEVRATGGTMRSPLWRALVAAALARPMIVGHALEGSALGAAVMGLVGLGEADDLASARRLLVGDDSNDDRVPVSAELAEAAAATRRRIAALGGQLAEATSAYDPAPLELREVPPE
ncbi:MAG TPA: gluconokinase [Acidimicrobiales bacterium]|nr:gluconokinase [Acidimicrobiales bacterium]